MKHAFVCALIGLFASLTAIDAHATFSGFTSNPTSNSTDWSTYVTGLGGSVQTLDFEAHPIGALQSAFYFGSHGVTLTAVGDLNQVSFSTGAPVGSLTPPLSNGEGLFTGSRVVGSSVVVGAQLIVTFNQPVWGAGLFTVDYYNPGNVNPAKLDAYAGPNGTGTHLGTALAVPFNFQLNHLYFFGVADDALVIQSIVFTDGNMPSDGIWIDNIKFAVSPIAIETSTWVGIKSLYR